jgi:hypothetical protein
MELKKVENKIFELRDHKVMLDFDMASIYEVETKVLNQSVKRNLDRFPLDFMFQLTKEKFEMNRSQFVTGSQKHRGEPPLAFTEQGIAMLSGILKSKKAIEVNSSIMRAFVFMRQYALTHKDLTDKLKKLESKFNKKFKDIHAAISYLIEKDMTQEKQLTRKKIGY